MWVDVQINGEQDPTWKVVDLTKTPKVVDLKGTSQFMEFVMTQ